MPVQVIDTLKPKNGLDFPVVEAEDVEVSEGVRLPEALGQKAEQTDLEELSDELAGKASASELNTATANLQAQIDELITPVTQDAEVQNARVAADGTTYTTLKARLDASDVTVSTVKRGLDEAIGATVVEEVATAQDYTLGRYINESGAIATASDLLGNYTFSGTKGQKVRAYAKNMSSPLAIIATADNAAWDNISVVATLEPSEEGWAEYTLTRDCYVICSSRVSGYSPKVVVQTKLKGRLDEIEESIPVDIATSQTICTYANNNVADLSGIIPGKRFKSDGSGDLEDSSDSGYTDYIYVDSTKYNYFRARYIKSGTTPSSATIRCMMYDAAKHVIGYESGANAAIPYGTNYIRFSTPTDSYIGTPNISESLMVILVKDANEPFTEPSEYIGYSATVINQYLFDKNDVIRPKYKIVVNGDSITYGYNPTPSDSRYAGFSQLGNDNYCRKACDSLGYVVDNYAITNSTLTDYAGDGTTSDPLCVRYTQMSDIADLVYIAIGTNDATSSSVQLGTFEDRTTTTFYGALHTLCQGLREKYSDIPIVFATPIKRVYATDTMTPVDMTDYINAMKEVCAYYGISVFDMNIESRINAWLDYDIQNYIPDGIHPNLAGHKRMAIAFKHMLFSYLPQSY